MSTKKTTKKAVKKKSTRKQVFARQRQKRGWDDSETWSLDDTVVHFVLPRLKRFKEVTNGYPGCFKSMKQWEDVLDKMILGFEMAKKGAWSLTTEEHQQAQEGIDLFAKHFFSLWW